MGAGLWVRACGCGPVGAGLWVRACGDERAQDVLKGRLLGGRTAEDFIENVYMLRGLKTAYATRFSASLGAQYRASFGAYESCVRQINVLSDTLDPHIAQQFATDQRRGKVRFFSARDQAFIGERLAELIGVHADASAPLRNTDDDTTKLRVPVPDDFLDAFVAWHRDNKEAVNALSRLINELSGRRLEDAAAADDLHEPLAGIFERYARLADSYRNVTRSVQEIKIPSTKSSIDRGILLRYFFCREGALTTSRRANALLWQGCLPFPFSGLLS